MEDEVGRSDTGEPAQQPELAQQPAGAEAVPPQQPSAENGTGPDTAGSSSPADWIGWWSVPPVPEVWTSPVPEVWDWDRGAWVLRLPGSWWVENDDYGNNNNDKNDKFYEGSWSRWQDQSGPWYGDRGERDGRDQDTPTFDGKTAFKSYLRRVELWMENTSCAMWKRGLKLLGKLEGDAWEHCEVLETKALKNDEGVTTLLNHLRRRFEQIEALRVGRTLDDFLYEFHRHPDEEIREYDGRFQQQLYRVEAIIGALNPVMKAHIFLKKARLPPEKQSQITSGAPNKYEYEALRDSTLASIPRVPMIRGRDRDVPAAHHQEHPRRQRDRDRGNRRDRGERRDGRKPYPVAPKV